MLKKLSSKDDLSYFLTVQSLLDYISDSVVKPQLHIDLIIAEFHSLDRPITEFIDLIRTSVETYSFNNFKLSAIPIVLFTDVDPRIDYKKLNVDLIVNRNNTKEIDNFSDKLASTIRDWRMRIFDDLEILGIGIDYNFDNIDTSTGYAVRVKIDQTKILSKAFLFRQQPLPYLWLKSDFFEFESSISELEKLTNQYLVSTKEKLQRIQWEEQFQDFFNTHPSFLFEKNYSEYWSRPVFQVSNSRRSFKPDFVKKPILSSELSKNWDIIDLKLPLMEFIQQTNFHPTFTSKFLKCLEQIKNYKSYFMADVNKRNIERVLNFHPKFPKLTLVVGKRNAIYENQDILYQKLNERNFSDINLLAYDEIVDNQKRELERLMNIRI